MKSLETDLIRDFDISTLSTTSLNSLYDQTIEGLRKHAQISPEEESDKVNYDDLESSLLDFEVSVLTQAAQIPLENANQINDLIDLWGKASGIHDGVEVRSTDKIVMNIFRHLSGRLG